MLRACSGRGLCSLQAAERRFVGVSRCAWRHLYMQESAATEWVAFRVGILRGQGRNM